MSDSYKKTGNSSKKRDVRSQRKQKRKDKDDCYHYTVNTDQDSVSPGRFENQPVGGSPFMRKKK